MEKKFKVVIVGAGAAGYFAAAAIKRNIPESEVEIIYDPKLGHLGVGESLGWVGPHFFREVLGLEDEHAWMKDSGSSYKWGVKHLGFDGTQDPYYFSYAFNGPVRTLEKSVMESKLGDICYGDKYSLYDMWLHLYKKGLRTKDQNRGDFHELHYYAEHNTSPFDAEGNSNTCRWINHSYHINANSIRHTVHKLVGKPAGVKEKPIGVKETVVTPDGQEISHLILDNDEIVKADLFIDCTGFQRVLVKNLPYVFEPCDEYFNNAAMVGSYFYKDYEKHDAWTQLISMPYGWRFSISMDNRSGEGYQFNRNIFDNEDELVSQYEKSAGKKNVIGRVIKWDPGYYRDAYVGNCIVLGIGHGFADVFDANNFTGTLRFIERLIKHLKQDHQKTMSWKNDFNYYVHELCEDIKFRIQCAFHLAPRNDTKYWELMKEGARKNNTLEKIKETIFNDTRKLYQGHQNVFYSQHTFINTMLYYNIPIDLPNFPFTKEQEELAINFFNYFNNKNSIQAKNAEPLGKYYERTIFKDIEFTPKDQDL